VSGPRAYETLESAAADLNAGRVTSEALVEQALAAITDLNPRLAALTEVLATSAIRDARRVDQARAGGRAKGALAGIPVVIKDNIDTRGAVCAAGLPFLSDYRAPKDAPAVGRLRRAGAIILGVSATDPGAFGVRTPAVTHPQAPALTVGGSSGGSAAALAAGFCHAALGTDTGGSIRIPAACCLLAGLKPTYGRVSTFGVRPLAPSADHLGPLTRRACDLEPIAATLDPGFSRTTRQSSVQLPKIGHAPAYWLGAAPAVAGAMFDAQRAARTLGAEIREVALPTPDEVSEVHVAILAAESAAYHFSAFPDRLDEYQPLARSLFAIAREQRGHEYVLACQRRQDIRERVDHAFAEVDFLLLPTLPVTPPRRDAETVEIDGITRDFTWALVRYTALFNHTGHPVVSLPVSVTAPGVGSSVQIVGRHNRDRDVVRFAAALEKQLDLSIDWSVRAPA
jgi:Asp-tRNA(Asn)/Glu-tRNA(Gln) amidotransferase A subunit family amidase